MISVLILHYLSLFLAFLIGMSVAYGHVIRVIRRDIHTETAIKLDNLDKKGKENLTTDDYGELEKILGRMEVTNTLLDKLVPFKKHEVD